MKLFSLYVKCHLNSSDSTPIFDSYIQSPHLKAKRHEITSVLPSIIFMGRTHPPKFAFCHFFVLTTVEGERNYGCCILFGENQQNATSPNNSKLIQEQSINNEQNNLISDIEKKSHEVDTKHDKLLFAIAITSILPIYQTLKNVLTCILDAFPNDDKLSQFIIHQIPLPPPGITAIQFSINNVFFLVPRPPPNQLPLIDLPFWIPFALFHPNDLIMIFTAILTEQRIVFSSRYPAAIAPFIESILTLIYPLTCYSTYIPNLAVKMAPILDSPLPYLIGVDPSVISLDTLESDVLLVDLDTSSLYVAPESVPPPIPSKPRAKLLKALRSMAKLFSRPKNDSNDSSSDDSDSDDNDKSKNRTSSIVIDDNDEDIQIDENRKWTLNFSSLVKQPIYKINSNQFNFTIPPEFITLPLMNGLFPEMINPKKKNLFSTFKKVRNAFLRFIIVLLMNTKQVSGADLNPKNDYSNSKFYDLFVNTQCFDVFINKINAFKQKGLKVETLDDARILFFIESVQAKKNRSKLSKNKLTPFLTSTHWEHTTMFVVPPIPSKFSDDDSPCEVVDLVENADTLTFSRKFTVPLKVMKSIIITSPLTFNEEFPSEDSNILKKIVKNGSKKKAVIIEKNIRGFIERARYFTMKKSALILHSFARMAICKEFYNKKMKPAALKLHSTVRMFLAKKKFKEMKKAAILIQSTFRMYKQRQEYLRMKKAAILIQSTFRMYKQRQEYLRMKKAAILIQSTFRMYKQRQEYLRMKKAAIKIQSVFRMFLLKKKYKEIKKNATSIQSVFRGFLARNQFKKILEEKKQRESSQSKRSSKAKSKHLKEKASRNDRKSSKKNDNDETIDQVPTNPEVTNSPDAIDEQSQSIQSQLRDNQPETLGQQVNYFFELAQIPFHSDSVKTKKRVVKESIKQNKRLLKKDEKIIYKAISKLQKKKIGKKKFDPIFNHFQIPVQGKKRKDQLTSKIFDILVFNPTKYSFEITSLAAKIVAAAESKIDIAELNEYFNAHYNQ